MPSRGVFRALLALAKILPLLMSTMRRERLSRVERSVRNSRFHELLQVVGDVGAEIVAALHEIAYGRLPAFRLHIISA
jgi:hypothetical protein